MQTPIRTMASSWGVVEADCPFPNAMIKPRADGDMAKG